MFETNDFQNENARLSGRFLLTSFIRMIFSIGPASVSWFFLFLTFTQVLPWFPSEPGSPCKAGW